jgi:DNA-binding transcriptional LysR family regulator
MTHNTQLFDGVAIFVQVVKSGGFAAAANTLGHSNSHISKTIHQLENRLGVRLLNRTTRSIALTSEGETYYQACLTLLEMATNATNLVTAHDDQPRGKLKISAPIWFGMKFLRPIFTAYLKKYPAIQLDIDLSDMTTDVVGDGFDIVIRATTHLPESTLICRRIYQCDIQTVASPAYFERYGRPSHPRELIDHSVACYSNLKSPDRWEYQTAKNETNTFLVEPKIRCNFSEMSLALVTEGLAIGRFPEFYLGSLLNENKLEIIFPECKTESVSVYVLYPSRQNLSPKVRCFISLLVDFFEK